MNTMLGFFFGIAVFATLIVLVIGIVSFAIHGPFYKKHANHLMRLRVLFQALAIFFLAISVWLFAS